VSARFAEFDRIERGSAEQGERARSATVTEAFDALFGEAAYRDDALASASDAELAQLFDAANLATFYSFDARFAALQSRAMATLEQRGIATQMQYDDLYGSLVQVRRYDDARALYARHPDGLAPLPAMEAAVVDGTSRWRVSSPDQLVQIPAPFADGPTIVVVGHPLCHFTQDAFDAIGKDPALSTMFEHHAMLLVPIDRRFGLDDMLAWNTARPAFPMAYAVSRDEWPMFDAWATPTFYFFRDGRLVSKVTGWPKEGHRDEVLRAAHAIGLTTADDKGRRN
jgi:hypothetical protein